MSDNPFSSPALMLVTGRECIPASDDPADRLIQVVAAAVRGGVSVVQLRERNLSETIFLQVLSCLRDILPSSVPIIPNISSLSPHAIETYTSMPFLTRPHTHTPTHAPTTLHLPEHVPKPPNGIAYGRSVHTVEAACRAEAEGACYLVAGSIFPTNSHPGGEAKGLSFLGKVCRAVSIPVLAIGGILPERVPLCLEQGAAGAAVRSPILSAACPQTEAARYRAALNSSLENVTKSCSRPV